MFEDQQKLNFSPEQIDNFVGLYHILNKIHRRLISEGYKVKGGKITPPKNTLLKLP